MSAFDNYFYPKDRPQRSRGIELERVRITHESRAWEQIPEQAMCVCAHVKGEHRRDDKKGETRCSHGVASAMRAIAKRIEGGEIVAVAASAPHGCRCIGFYHREHAMTWVAFAGRLLCEFDTGAPAMMFGLEELAPARPNLRARARAALTSAWKHPELGLDRKNPPRTWELWLHDSKRVWRAWREAGSPIRAFGKKGTPKSLSFGPIAIPVLEER